MGQWPSSKKPLDRGARGKKVLESTVEAGEGTRGEGEPGRVLSETLLGWQALARVLPSPLWLGDMLQTTQELS